MKANEFDAVHANTDLFAIAAYTVGEEVPQHLQRSKKPYGGGYTCPIGLVRARVIETNHPWTSMESFGCGPDASTHEVTHRNGVLVEITKSEAEAAGIKERAHVVPFARGMRMVITKKACIMPWSDYQPVRDARRKSQRESERRSTRIAAACQRVGAVRGSWHEYKVGDAKDYTFDERRAEVDVPLLVVEELGDIMDGLDDMSSSELHRRLKMLRETIQHQPAVREAVSADMNPPKKKKRRAR